MKAQHLGYLECIDDRHLMGKSGPTKSERKKKQPKTSSNLMNKSAGKCVQCIVE